MVCPNCETQIEEGREFCPACGAYLRIGAEDEFGPIVLASSNAARGFTRLADQKPTGPTTPVINPILLSLLLTVPLAVIGHLLIGLGLGFTDSMTRQDRELNLLGYDLLAIGAVILITRSAARKQ